MSARVRRGSAGPLRYKKAQPAGTGRRKRIERRVSRMAAFALGAFLLLIAAGTLVALGIPARAATETGEAVGRLGFNVRSVEVSGIRRMNSAPVYAIALDQRSMAMPLVNVHDVRRRLLQFGWVKDARVSRRLPDTLVIDIVERTPAAIWQDRGRLSLIDAEGVVLDRVPITRMPDLPLVIGPGANRRSRELRRLMDAVPTLKPQLVSATWIGERRWDLAFQSGEIVALPEGEPAARDALTKFASLDRSSGLLGRGLVRIDLRLPGKMIVRLPRAPADSLAPAGNAAQG